MFLSYTLVFSTQPPVSVYGTGTHGLSLEAFLGSLSPPLAAPKGRSRSVAPLCGTDLPIPREQPPNVIAIGRGKLKEPSLHWKPLVVQEY